MAKNKIRLVIFIAALGAFNGSLIAQSLSTLYFMQNTPQRLQLNPAFQPDYNFYLACPGNFEVSAWNNSFSSNDFFKFDEDAFLAAQKDVTNLLTNARVDLADFGFRYNKWFVGFGIATRADARVNAPKRWSEFIVNEAEPADYNLSDSYLNMMISNEFRMTVSKRQSDYLTWGVSGKILLGAANMQMNFNTLQINTDPDNWSYNANADVLISAPLLNIYTDSQNRYDSLEFDEEPSANAVLKGLTANKGLALDLGLVYKLSPQITLSASVIDLGFISWKNNNYEGGFDNAQNSYTVDPESDLLTAIADTLYNNTIIKKGNAYTTWMPTKVFLAGEYQPINWFSLGLVSRTYFLRSVNQQFTASANFRALRIVNFSVSYSMLNQSHKSLGLGLGLKAGPCHLYLVSDNLPINWKKSEIESGGETKQQMLPQNVYQANIRFGLNLVFGKPGKIKDTPLYSSTY